MKDIYVGIYTDDVIHLEEKNPCHLRAVGYIYVSDEQIEHAMVLPPDLQDDDMRYYCMLRAIKQYENQFIDNDIIHIYNNRSATTINFRSNCRSRLSSEMADLQHNHISITLEGQEEGMFMDRAIELAYDSIATYYFKRGYTSIPCFRCKKGALELKYGKNNKTRKKQFIGCSNYPRCRKTLKIPKKHSREPMAPSNR